ncbi:MAG: sulfotransferase family protein [Novosphingobium sp.]
MGVQHEGGRGWAMGDAAGYVDTGRIVARAERESGAFGLCGDELRGRVDLLASRINAAGPLDAADLRAVEDQMLRVLVNRLLIQLDRTRFPAIAGEPITRPVFIIGFARSGTTLLHSLLAEDPQALSPRSWHMYSPSPPPGAGPVVSGRMAYAQRQVEAWSDFCPAQKPLHPYIDKGALQLIEDEELFALDLRSAYPYHFYRFRGLEPGMTMLGSDPAGAFAFHRQMLQHLQWNTGKTRWVCKGPSHQMNLRALLDTYPDALCIWAHRPIGEIYASNVAIRAATYDAIRGEAVDWASQAKAHVMGMKAAVDALIASDLIDDPRVMHMAFRDIARDPLAAVGRVYDRLGEPFTDAAQAAMRGWLDDPENASDRYGKYPYTYEAFGLDRAWVESLFAEYSARFGLN